ncbi:hypothetical protein FSP39_016695 [Pinctada imbricata]|uniref:Uncharacterized protein n=1 Tax=Pinctada imbricata TaxID=66713 RepID=A0AA88XZR0_PINIB|nr:hypothetical protein FSP39_016695 [Pinctada imbricata]
MYLTVRGNLEGQTSSSSNEGERPAKRRKIKAKRASQSSSLSSQIISIDSNTDNSDNDVVIVKEEFIDPEYIGSSSIDTQEQSKEYGQINTVITEDTDNSHSSCAVYLDDSSLYKEALVDQIDVYVKEEPSDTEYSNKCSQEDFEPPVSEFAYIDDISVEKRPKLCVRKSRGVYQVYTSEEKAKIAKYAIENGIANCC